MGDLSLHFSSWEFRCKCGECADDVKPDKKLVAMLEQGRMFLEAPIHLTSGIRCQAHNKAVGGEEDSSHLRGKAAGIKVNGSIQRFRVVEALLFAGFKRLGIAEVFVHADVDESKPQEVMWLYPSNDQTDGR